MRMLIVTAVFVCCELISKVQKTVPMGCQGLCAIGSCTSGYLIHTHTQEALGLHYRERGPMPLDVCEWEEGLTQYRNQLLKLVGV